jgi:ABC-type sugar transport system permease subunit
MFTKDAVFRQALRNSVIATVVLAVVPTVIGLGFAALFSSLRAGGAYRSAIFFPYLVAMVSVGVIWGWIYNPRIGTIDAVLEAVGLGNLVHDWLGDSTTALGASLVAGIWRFTGFAIVIFYAAIQSIPTDLYEAARVDGASGWQSFWKITLPLVRDAMIVVVVWMTMDALKLFDLIFVLTKGGPNHATEVLATWMFADTFRHFKMGYGAAMSVVLFLMILVFSVVYIQLTTRGVEEA